MTMNIFMVSVNPSSVERGRTVEVRLAWNTTEEEHYVGAAAFEPPDYTSFHSDKSIGWFGPGVYNETLQLTIKSDNALGVNQVWAAIVDRAGNIVWSPSYRELNVISAQAPPTKVPWSWIAGAIVAVLVLTKIKKK